MHSIEHMMAQFMRNYTDRLVGFAPMGCLTGFYAITNHMDWDELLRAVEGGLNEILEATEVPAANEVQCGWGADHDLEGAKKWARYFLDHKDGWRQVMADGSEA